MYEKLMPKVLKAGCAPLSKKVWPQKRYIYELFRSYFDDEINATRASRIMHGGAPEIMVRYYADPKKYGCPDSLREDVRVCVELAYQVSSERRKLYEGLLAVIMELPGVDRAELMPEVIAVFPTENQLVELYSTLLYYAMNQDAAMKYLEAA